MILNRKNTIKILNNIKSKVAKDNRDNRILLHDTWICSYQEEICIISPFCEEGFDKPFVLDGEVFHKILSSMSSDEVTIEIDTGEFRIESNKTKARIPFIVDPILQSKIVSTVVSTYNIEFEPGDFIEGLTIGALFASKIASFGTLTSVNVVGNKIVSGNNMVASLYLLDKPVVEDFMVRAPLFNHLKRFKVISYGVNQSWVYFDTEEKVQFYFRRMKGNYPEFDSIINSVVGETIILPDTLKGMVAQAAKLSDDPFKTVAISLKDGVLRCSSGGSKGSIEKTERMEGEQGEFNIRVRAESMIKALEYGNKFIYAKDYNQLVLDTEKLKQLIILSVGG